MKARILRLGVPLLVIWFGSRPSAVGQQSQWYEGILKPESRASAFKSCDYLVRGGSKPEAETVLWLVDVQAQPERLADYFATFPEGPSVQIETTARKDSRISDVRLFDPQSPRRRFVRLSIRAARDQDECRGDLVSVFSTTDGEFVSCLREATSPTVIFNRAFLLAHADEEWMDALARVVIAFARDRQFKMAQLGFLQPLLDPDGVVVPASSPPQATPCRYADLKSQFEAKFRPREAIVQAYRDALKAAKP